MIQKQCWNAVKKSTVIFRAEKTRVTQKTHRDKIVLAKRSINLYAVQFLTDIPCIDPILTARKTKWSWNESKK